MYRYLLDHSHYSELYDRTTVEECRRWASEKFPDSLKEKIDSGEFKSEELEHVHAVGTRLYIYYLTANRAAEKSDTIQGWMKRDRERDDQLTNAEEPQNIRCRGCGMPLRDCISRDLMSDTNGKEAVLFMFECGKCAKRGAFWQDGTEWEYCPKCVECGAETAVDHAEKDRTIVTTYSCSRCGHVESDIMDLDEENIRQEEMADPEFEADRKKYCISELEGKEILRRADELKEFMDRWKEPELREAVEKIRTLTVVELQALLDPLLQKAGYVKFEFGKPDIRKDVVVEFSLQDAKPGREAYDSHQRLKKLLKEALEETNWRLMSDGIQYHLGCLDGRLRGVEGEENLRKLVIKP